MPLSQRGHSDPNRIGWSNSIAEPWIQLWNGRAETVYGLAIGFSRVANSNAPQQQQYNRLQKDRANDKIVDVPALQQVERDAFPH